MTTDVVDAGDLRAELERIVGRATHRVHVGPEGDHRTGVGPLEYGHDTVATESGTHLESGRLEILGNDSRRAFFVSGGLGMTVDAAADLDSLVLWSARCRANSDRAEARSCARTEALPVRSEVESMVRPHPEIVGNRSLRYLPLVAASRPSVRYQCVAAYPSGEIADEYTATTTTRRRGRLRSRREPAGPGACRRGPENTNGSHSEGTFS